eukprot:scaffold61869_cov65-Phaeocystis_antarctica.AAC.2
MASKRSSCKPSDSPALGVMPICWLASATAGIAGAQQPLPPPRALEKLGERGGRAEAAARVARDEAAECGEAAWLATASAAAARCALRRQAKRQAGRCARLLARRPGPPPRR